MTNDKSREFFSAFHEGTLEPGLAASLKRKLDADAGLQAEYEAFARTLESLDALRFEKIEAPFYLNDRISARIEGARDAKPVPFWATLFAPRATTPRFSYAVGLAATLLVASVGLRGMRSTDTSEASVIPASRESVVWTKTAESVIARFDGAAARTVAIAPEGGETQDYKLAARQSFELTLNNPNRLACRFKVIQGDAIVATVAVPGSHAAPRRAGSGTLSEFATALADVYRIPVVVKGLPIGTAVRWKFDSIDARTAAEESLDGHGSAIMMESGVLQIAQ